MMAVAVEVDVTTALVLGLEVQEYPVKVMMVVLAAPGPVKLAAVAAEPLKLGPQELAHLQAGMALLQV